MQMRFPIFGSFLLLSAAVQAAQPYICRSNGKTIITDQPCDGSISARNSAAAQLPPPVAAPPKPVAVRPAPSPPPMAQVAAPVKQKESGASFSYVLMLLGAVAAVIWFLRRPGGDRPLFEGTALRGVSSDGDPDEELPYAPAPLMSRYEKEMFDRIRLALPEFEVFPQVPLAAFVRVDRRKAGSDFSSNSYRWQNRLSQQRVDYLLCRKDDLNIVAAVELDDPSHDREEAGNRDRKKSKSLADAGIRLVRWRVEVMPSANDIRGAFFDRPQPAM